MEIVWRNVEKELYCIPQHLSISVDNRREDHRAWHLSGQLHSIAEAFMTSDVTTSWPPSG